MAKPAGKYDAIMPTLPKAPPADPSYQEKVDELKRSVTDRSAISLASQYVDMRARKAALDAQLYDVNMRIAAYEQLLADSQEQQAAGWGDYGVKDNAIKLPSGDTIRIQREPSGKVVNKEAFRLWCIYNGYENQLQLWPSTMNGIVKERLVAGEPVPDGTEAYAYTKVVFTKKGSE